MLDTVWIDYSETATVSPMVMREGRKVHSWLIKVKGCERCASDAYVPHFSCLYHGQRIGHKAEHCTADACY